MKSKGNKIFVVEMVLRTTDCHMAVHADTESEAVTRALSRMPKGETLMNIRVHEAVEI